jgi:hypothetical protein
VVDYRGPKFLESLCERWNLDLFDRVVEIQLLEETALVRESVVNCPELQTMTLLPRFSLHDSNAWVKVAEQVQDLPVEVFLTVYENNGQLVPYSLVVLGARRTEPWVLADGYRRRSIAEYLEDQDEALAEALPDAVPSSCDLNTGLLACSPTSQAP